MHDGRLKYSRPDFREMCDIASTKGDAEMNVSRDELILYEAELGQIQDVVDRLLKRANAAVVFLVDKSGQPIAACGDTGNLGAPEAASSCMERGNEIHVQRVGGRAILVTIYPRETSRLALVLQCVRTASDELCHILDTLNQKMQRATFDRFFPEVTNEDIDELFSERTAAESKP